MIKYTSRWQHHAVPPINPDQSVPPWKNPTDPPWRPLTATRKTHFTAAVLWQFIISRARWMGLMIRVWFKSGLIYRLLEEQNCFNRFWCLKEQMSLSKIHRLHTVAPNFYRLLHFKHFSMWEYYTEGSVVEFSLVWWLGNELWRNSINCINAGHEQYNLNECLNN